MIVIERVTVEQERSFRFQHFTDGIFQFLLVPDFAAGDLVPLGDGDEIGEGRWPSIVRSVLPRLLP